MLVQAESGLASITGTPDAPARVGFLCDIASGMYAHSAVLAALLGATKPARARRSPSPCSTRWPIG